MDVNIGDIITTVHAVDGDSLLTPQTLEQIVRVVLEAVREEEEHRLRVRAEQQVTAGVREELEESWG